MSEAIQPAEPAPLDPSFFGVPLSRYRGRFSERLYFDTYLLITGQRHHDDDGK